MDLRPGTLIVSRYLISRVVGRGAVGTVYRATDMLLDETVALKVLRPDVDVTPERARRFRREVKLARRLAHPNVCRVHEYGEDAAVRFLCMEFIEGHDVKELIRRRGPLPPADAYELAIQVGQGLEAVHSAGLVHRDLTARNVMRELTGRAKITDFGFARSLDSHSGSPGQLAGTPEYMSPEQARGARVDARSDLYSLGVLVYEMFTGAVPFRGDTPLATLFQQIHDPAPLAGPRAERLPERLVAVLETALAKRPDGRYASAADMVEALKIARDATGAVAPAPFLVVPAGASTREIESTFTPSTETMRLRPGRRRPIVALLAAAATAAAVAGALLAMFSPRPLPAAKEAARAPGEATALPSAPRPARPASVRVGLRKGDAIPHRRRPDPAALVTAADVVPTDVVLTDAERLPVLETGHEPPAREPGRLQIGVRPWAEVSVDGRSFGETPIAALTLRPGVYTARLVHPDYRPFQRKVTIEPGETSKLFVDLALDGIPR